jgi:hypothetical protein
MLFVTFVPEPGDLQLTVGPSQPALYNLPNGIRALAALREFPALRPRGLIFAARFVRMASCVSGSAPT